ncbi:hypothetical protein [Acanthopleuribacter pedis]|uniref:Uncharacterized protein n=1 Tax=Acanthopleuribacter pedis TaxID=442870 RepID=A0A8J7U856_9BACT|nr:hypothetical protein [Acanthopleuribacter pedis]MBO1322146.1 hypothetical protein [Acanthopleuribacter pedis]
MIAFKPMLRLLVTALLGVSPAFAQLGTVFDQVFEEILVNRLQLSPGQHGDHFREAAFVANSQLTPSLNTAITNNVSSFPNSNTSIGVTFSFESGAPEKIRRAIGPVFGESATTLGKKRLNLGMNTSRLTMDRFRGLDTRDLTFTFTHVDVTNDGTLGENPSESDTIDVALGMDVDATILAFYASYGLTDRLDISVSAPYIDISLDGTAVARVDSFTLAAVGMANHHFGDDPTRPILESQVPYSESAAGLGDVSVRAKYNAFNADRFQLGFFFDYRFDNGDESDFLGTGSNEFRVAQVLSGGDDNYQYLINLAFEKRPGDLDSDEIELLLGFNYEVGNGFAWAVELMGDYDLNDLEAINLLNDSVEIVDRSGDALNPRQVRLSNIPDRSDDHTLNASLGLRWAPTDKLILLGNLLIPLNDAGLRSNVVATAGFGYNF